MVRNLICALNVMIFAHSAHAMEQTPSQNNDQKQTTSGKLSENDSKVLHHIVELHRDKDNNPILWRLIPACSDLIQHPHSFVLYKCLTNTTKENEKKGKITNRSILVLLIASGAPLTLKTSEKVARTSELMNTIQSKISKINERQKTYSIVHDADQTKKLTMRKAEYVTIHGRLVKAFEELAQLRKLEHSNLIASANSQQEKTNAEPAGASRQASDIARLHISQSDLQRMQEQAQKAAN